jgi:uncharacterized membrane protein YGL010W
VKNLSEHLTEYAGYHRDKRNIATHFVGIPMIVIAVGALFGAIHPWVAWGAFGVSAALFYLRLELRFGLAMVVFNGACMWAGLHFGLWEGVAIFAAGWVLQFIGHWFEGRKPAFVDDLVGLLVGPLFIVAEAAFMLGLRKPLLAEIEAKVGPTRINPRRGGVPAA